MILHHLVGLAAVGPRPKTYTFTGGELAAGAGVCALVGFMLATWLWPRVIAVLYHGTDAARDAFDMLARWCGYAVLLAAVGVGIWYVTSK